MKDDFLSNSARLYVFFFFISLFCSLLINTCLVFISYFVSVPLRRGYRGSRISVFICSFVPVSFCIFDYLYSDLVFRRLFCNTCLDLELTCVHVQSQQLIDEVLHSLICCIRCPCLYC